jgi:hypothetical protein
MVDSTGLFKRGDAIPTVGYVPGAAVFAFQRSENEVSDLLENDDGYYIFQVKQKVKKGILPLAIARSRIVAALSETSRLAKARAHVDAFLKKNADVKDVSHYSKFDSFFVSGTTDTVGREQYIPGVGFNNKPVAAAFALPDGAVSPVIDAGDVFFVVKPLWHKKSTEIPWTGQEVLALRRKMMSEAGQQNFTDWYMDLKNRAKIVDNVNQFYIE